MRVIAKGNVTEILIYEDIGEYFGGVSAAEFHRELGEITGPALVRLNSPGGNFHDGVAIRNLMASRGDVSVVVDGLAASAASIIAMGGETIEMAKGSHMMYHPAWTIEAGDASHFRDVADRLDILNGSMAQVYADRSGKSKDDIIAKMSQGDTWMDADTAVAEGFADSVSSAPAVAAYIDQNVYSYKMPEAAKVLIARPHDVIVPTKHMSSEERSEFIAAWEKVSHGTESGEITEMAEGRRLMTSVAARRLSLTGRGGFA